MLMSDCFVACVMKYGSGYRLCFDHSWPAGAGAAMRRSPPLPAPMRSNSAVGVERHVTDPVHCRRLCTSVLSGSLRCDDVASNVRTPLIHAEPVSSSRTHCLCGESNSQSLSRRCPYLGHRLRRSNATQNQTATARIARTFWPVTAASDAHV